MELITDRAPARNSAVVSSTAAAITTADAILGDLARFGLDALFQPLTWRRLRRCSPAARDKIRAQLSRFIFLEDAQ
jgi:hypothetical protein